MKPINGLITDGTKSPLILFAPFFFVMWGFSKKMPSTEYASPDADSASTKILGFPAPELLQINFYFYSK
jgi:hypothetical protein